jgi:hypothetical protein
VVPWYGDPGFCQWHHQRGQDLGCQQLKDRVQADLFQSILFLWMEPGGFAIGKWTENGWNRDFIIISSIHFLKTHLI